MRNLPIRWRWVTPILIIIGVILGGCATTEPVGSIQPSAVSADEGIAAYERGDIDTALRVFRPLAKQGNANAQYYMGGIYSHGRGVPIDYKKALKWYRKAAEQGHAEAQYTLGLMYEIGPSLLERPETKDYKEALKWYRKAAEQGVPKAQYKLGHYYRYALGVSQDYKEAAKWFRKAAEQGNARAQYTLGLMHAHAQGFERDYVHAFKWFSIAGANGYKPTIYNCDDVAVFMTASQVAEAKKMAREWIKQHQ